ncbi:MAG: GTP cyclohydrolase II [Bacteroidota bacterium]
MKRQAEAVLPTKWGNFNMVAYADDNQEQMPHLAMVHENFDHTEEKTILVRIHSECMTGDLFHSHRCDCGEQLDTAMQLTAEHGGVVIYLRQEGRGIGLINKLKAYQLQDTGINTADANLHLGLEVDARHYDIAVRILQDLKIKSIDLLTNNPDKIKEIDDSPIIVKNRVPLIIQPKRENRAYLQTKQDLMGHLFKL